MNDKEHIRKIIREHLSILINEEVKTVYRGAGDTPNERRLWYFTTNRKYANWFKKHHAIGNPRIFKANIDVSNFLDLRFIKKKINYLDFHSILTREGINPPKFIIDNIDDGYGWSSFFLWEFLKADKSYELWDEISKKFDGVIFYETNPQARHTKTAETVIIDMKYHPIQYEEEF